MATFRIITNLRNLASNNRSQCLKLASICSHQQYFSSKVDKQPESLDAEKKKKTVRIPKITLVSPDESMQVVSLDEAKKISNRRDLKLIKVIDLDTKTQRPVYKLMSGSDYHAEDLKQREIRKEKKQDIALKGEKLLLINSRISEHDLESRIKNILRWLNKKYEIRVVLTGDSSNMETCESVYNIIEQRVNNDSRILQKRVKGNELKFQILPPKHSKQKSDDGRQNNL